MGIAVSIALLTHGAIIILALDRVVWGIDLDSVGVGLMVIGAIGAVGSMARWKNRAPDERPGLAVAGSHDSP